MGELDKNGIVEHGKLLFELSHKDRLATLHILKNEPLRLSHHSQRLDITTAEGSRHLDRLVDADLVHKKADTHYYLTHFGESILLMLKEMEFIHTHKSYFNTHEIMAIPENFQCLAMLTRCQLSEGVFKNVKMVEELSIQAEEFINLISESPLETVVDTNLKRANEGIPVRIIYKTGTEIPEAYNAVENIEVRFLPEHRFALKFTETRGGLALPDLSGNIDINTVLVSQDEMFMNWCNTLFEYLWEKAEN